MSPLLSYALCCRLVVLTLMCGGMMAEQGLRVADASIAPHMPCAPTQAMSYMIGHHAAKLLLQDLIGHPT